MRRKNNYSTPFETVFSQFEDMFRTPQMRPQHQVLGFGDASMHPLADSTARVNSQQFDIMETDDEVRVTVDVPGFDPDELTISLDEDGRYLKIRGEHATETSDEQQFKSRSNRIQKQIPLPVQVDSESATAEYKNGVLSVSLTKAVVEETDNTIEIEWVN